MDDKDKDEGLQMKFHVMRRDGSSEPGKKHEHCFYIVLDTVHDAFSTPAIQRYADAAGKEGYYQFAGDLYKLLMQMPATTLFVEQVVNRIERQTADDGPEYQRLAKLRAIGQEFFHLVHGHLVSLAADGAFAPFDFDEAAIEPNLVESVEHLAAQVMNPEEATAISDQPEIELAGACMLLWLQRRVLQVAPAPTRDKTVSARSVLVGRDAESGAH